VCVWETSQRGNDTAGAVEFKPNPPSRAEQLRSAPRQLNSPTREITVLPGVEWNATRRGGKEIARNSSLPPTVLVAIRPYPYPPTSDPPAPLPPGAPFAPRAAVPVWLRSALLCCLRGAIGLDPLGLGERVKWATWSLVPRRRAAAAGSW
jgi:hypothetical protein